jgi:hypothetical protein
MSVLTPEFWAAIAPELTVSPSLDVAAVARCSLDGGERGELPLRMRRDGFFVAEAVLPAEQMARLKRGVESVRARFGHEVFALLYDEFWSVLARVSSLIELVLGSGHRVVPLPYVNYVPPGDAGFGPHRDRNDRAVTSDGLPNFVTAWISLTDAGAERACLSLLPACRDRNFPERLERLEIHDLRDVRSAPVPAGSVICFNQALLHWGTRNAAPEPRVSFAFELERASFEEAREPCIPLDAPLTFDQRLGFVGAVVGMLSHSNVQFTSSELAAARSMCESVHGERFAPFFDAPSGAERTSS